MIVIADTSPINYPVLIGEINLLKTLYGDIILPLAVKAELLHPAAPERVRLWMQSQPEWVQVRTAKQATDHDLDRLDAGEREAILLAEEIGADLLLLDETLGRREAKRRHLPVIGTLGILLEAAERGLVDIESAVDRLKDTSFHISPSVLSAILKLKRE